MTSSFESWRLTIFNLGIDGREHRKSRADARSQAGAPLSWMSERADTYQWARVRHSQASPRIGSTNGTNPYPIP
jgi:hypothetical protein